MKLSTYEDHCIPCHQAKIDFLNYTEHLRYMMGSNRAQVNKQIAELHVALSEANENRMGMIQLVEKLQKERDWLYEELLKDGKPDSMTPEQFKKWVDDIIENIREDSS